MSKYSSIFRKTGVLFLISDVVASSESEGALFGSSNYGNNKVMNRSEASTAFWAARDAKMPASLETAEPPPAKSDRALIAMNGICCWWQTRATAALSMSIGVILNLELRNSR